MRPRILICDDEPIIATAVADHLRGCGHACDVHGGARSVLASLTARADDVALIITDLCMPDRDGLRLAEGVRDLGLSIPLILMTSHLLPNDYPERQPCGIIAVLRKPLHLSELEATVAAAISPRVS